MLAAHLVPGYFLAAASQPRWDPTWPRAQRRLLWAAALAGSVLADADACYNVLVRGFVSHSTLWTHSLFVYLALGLAWWLLWRVGRWPYLTALFGLALAGGLSHLLLDVISHSTPLFYPLSWRMIGAPPRRVLEGGAWAYVTDPLFLLEPLLAALAAGHWACSHVASPRLRRLVVAGLAGALAVFTAFFLAFLPALQRIAAAHGAG